MKKPHLLVLSLGGTITMVPSDSGGITPKLGAAELVASVPALAEVGDIDARSPFRLPSPSLTPANLVEVASTIREAFASGFDGAVVIQGTDTIEESAFLLDLLVDSDKPVVVTGAMRGADAPGADGPANLLSAAIVAACPESHGLGTLAVLNYDIHAARFVQKSHTALPSAFLSPLVGPIGTLIERQPRFYVRVKRNPTLSTAEGPPAPVALIKAAMGDDGRLFGSLPGLGYAGVVLEGMGAGHVPADVAPHRRRPCGEDPGGAREPRDDGPRVHAHLRLSRLRDRSDPARGPALRVSLRSEGAAAARARPAVRQGRRQGLRGVRALSIADREGETAGGR